MILAARIVFQSPKTVVLSGQEILTSTSEVNTFLWQGVDVFKEKGYTIDAVFPVGTGTMANPTYFYVIMSHP